MHLPDLHYDCVSCGKSCTDFQVEVDRRDLPRLEASPTTQALSKAGFTPLQVQGSKVFIQKLEAGRCCYLSDETLCRLHQEGGFAHKPKTCQDFPFVPVATPDGVYVGLSFYCTAVAQSAGRPLKERQAEFGFLLDSIPPEMPAADSQWSLWGSQAVDWANYLSMENFLRMGLEREPRKGLLQAVWRLGSAVRKGDHSFLTKPLPEEGLDSDALQGIVKKIMPRIESVEESASQEIAQSLAHNQGFQSLALGHWLDFTPPPSDYPDWLSKELTRYTHHLLFRKSLLSAPNVLSRACLIALSAPVVLNYSYARARYHRRSIEREDYHKAVGLLEGRLMLHAFGMGGLMEEWAGEFLDLEWI